MLEATCLIPTLDVLTILFPDNFSIPYKYNQDEYLYRLSPNGAFINFTRYSVDFLSTDARQATGAFYLHQAHDSILNITEKRAIIKQKRSIVAR
jgi:hypothetical protein